MANPGHSAAAHKRTLAALKKANGVAEQAAKLEGVTPATYVNRLKSARVWEAKQNAGMAVDPDPFGTLRLKEENRDLKRTVKEAQKKVIELEDVRKNILGLSSKPILPARLKKIKHKVRGVNPEVPIIFSSDWHFGEVIDLDEMAGTNSYDTSIARNRYNQLINKTILHMTEWWIGPPPEVCYFLRGGDAISGEIHEELRETNDDFAIPAVSKLVKLEAAGLQRIRDEVGCEVVVISVPGNHGRTTVKPRAKAFAIDNYDFLTHTMLEWHFSGQNADWITFSAPASGEALFEIYDKKFLLMHGDRMGSGGGQGFIGALSPITRGHKKTFDAYAGRGHLLDVILSAHFHTRCLTEYGYGNGCLPGPSEYSHKLKTRPRPASQWFFSVNHIGITRQAEIFVGHPSEGSLYKE